MAGRLLKPPSILHRGNHQGRQRGKPQKGLPRSYDVRPDSDFRIAQPGDLQESRSARRGPLLPMLADAYGIFVDNDAAFNHTCRAPHRRQIDPRPPKAASCNRDLRRHMEAKESLCRSLLPQRQAFWPAAALLVHAF